MLYFAYGSNLNLDDYGLHFRADLLRKVCKAWLPDHEIQFSRYGRGRKGGALNLHASVGSVVPGMLFEVLGNGWEDLDKKEGHPGAYRRQSVFVLDEAGDELAAITYIAASDGFFPPDPAYVETVRSGMSDFDVDGATMVDLAAADQRRPSGVDGLFVYGTLLRGESRANHLQGAAASPARTRGRLLDCGAYPGLVVGEGWVQGELVHLDAPERMLNDLDNVEGFRGFGVPGALFRRTLAQVEVECLGSTLAWTYRYAAKGETLPTLAGGSWRARGVATTNAALR